MVTRNIKYGVILQYRNVCLPKSSLIHEIQSLHPSHCVRIIIWPVYLNRKYIRKRTELERGRGDCCNVPLSIVNFASTAVASSSAVLGGRPSSLRPPEAVAFSSLRPSVRQSVRRNASSAKIAAFIRWPDQQCCQVAKLWGNTITFIFPSRSSFSLLLGPYFKVFWCTNTGRHICKGKWVSWSFHPQRSYISFP